MNTIDIGPGLSGLLSFCNWLNKKGITYSIHKYSDDALTIFFTIVGQRVEVQFFEDWWNFSFFSGDESVMDTKEELLTLIGKHWSAD
jgi:hypothetical protein